MTSCRQERPSASEVQLLAPRTHLNTHTFPLRGNCNYKRHAMRCDTSCPATLHAKRHVMPSECGANCASVGDHISSKRTSETPCPATLHAMRHSMPSATSCAANVALIALRWKITLPQRGQATRHARVAIRASVIEAAHVLADALLLKSARLIFVFFERYDGTTSRWFSTSQKGYATLLTL